MGIAGSMSVAICYRIDQGIEIDQRIESDQGIEIDQEKR
jgi:hypothetical protein